jgi:putative tryptophan/tyrosine transport system substrate-binding protein
MRRACLLAALGAGAFAASLSAAQPAPLTTYRVSYVTGSSEPARRAFIEAFLQSMASQGYERGRNLAFQARFADGDFARLPALVQEAIRLKPDVLFVSTTPASLAAQAATRDLPIVFVGVADPVGVGLVKNLGRPGANITGVTNITAELTGKRIALLKELIPRASRIAILINPDDPNASIQMKNAREAAASLGVTLEPVLNVRNAADLTAAFAAVSELGVVAALRMVDPTASMLRTQTARLAAKHRVAVMFPFREDVQAGGLAAYGPSLSGQYRQAATFVHKILRGALPGDLPVERPTTFEFALNTKAAKTLGLNIPRALLVQAELLVE